MHVCVGQFGKSTLKGIHNLDVRVRKEKSSSPKFNHQFVEMGDLGPPKPGGKILVLSKRDVELLLPMTECISLVEEAFRLYTSNAAVNPLRRGLRFPDETGLIGIMPAFTPPRSAGAKIISIMHGDTGFPSHQGGVILFDAETGQLLSLIEGGSLTAIRTAAASGVATKLLAREDARVLSILGTGEQAYSHIAAMVCVRSITSVRIWGRTPEKAEKVALFAREKFKLDATVASTVGEAIAGSDIICAVTGATEPILLGSEVPEGVHINAVGACVPKKRECDTACLAKASLYTDSIEACENEAGDYIIPLERGEIDKSHIKGEIGSLLLRKLEGRTSAAEITLFKSLGIGAEDVVCARALYQKACREGSGTSAPFA